MCPLDPSPEGKAAQHAVYAICRPTHCPGRCNACVSRCFLPRAAFRASRPQTFSPRSLRGPVRCRAAERAPAPASSPQSWPHWSLPVLEMTEQTYNNERHVSARSTPAGSKSKYTFLPTPSNFKNFISLFFQKTFKFFISWQQLTVNPSLSDFVKSFGN